MNGTNSSAVAVCPDRALRRRPSLPLKIFIANGVPSPVTRF